MIIKETVNEISLTLDTGNYYFSPNSIDKGTRQMLNVLFSDKSEQPNENDKVLDLGCGYGIVGIIISKVIGGEHVVMSDVSEEAIALSNANLNNNGITGASVICSDGLRDINDDDFTLILSNPPFHSDFSVAKEFIEDGFKKLLVGGRLILVTKRLEWYKNKITSVFGGVKVYESEGYYVFIGEKRSTHVIRHKSKDKKDNMSKKLRRKIDRKNKSC